MRCREAFLQPQAVGDQLRRTKGQRRALTESEPEIQILAHRLADREARLECVEQGAAYRHRVGAEHRTESSAMLEAIVDAFDARFIGPRRR